MKCPECDATDENICDEGCDTCSESGECQDCFGDDDNCPECNGGGDCQECDGVGTFDGYKSCMKCGHTGDDCDFEEASE